MPVGMGCDVMSTGGGGSAGSGGECTHGGNASACATMVPLARERTADDGGGESATGVD
eukprot:COSAG01_NODE_54251_length_333_cov_1.055556_1_plen_57_part_01